MPAPKKNPLTNLIKKGAKKAVVKVKPKTKTKVAEPKSNVKVKKDPFANINSKAKASKNKPTGSNVRVIKNPFAGL